MNGPRIAIFQGGVMDEEEKLDLARLLAKFTGVIPGIADAEQLATRLPIDDPMPDFKFAGRKFGLTGKFVLGSRQEFEQIIHARGGTNHGQPAPDTNYLVFGALGSHDWLHSVYGRKVHTVLTNREQSVGTAIVSEEHWTLFLNSDPQAQSASS